VFVKMTKLRGASARKGSLNPTSKLTERQVIAIRKRYDAGGTSHRALAIEFKVGKATITRILSGKNWGWLASPNQRRIMKHRDQVVQTLDQDEWLANNATFFCEALKAKITRATCQQNHEMAREAEQSTRKSGLLGHPFYESAAKDRLYHCGSCPNAQPVENLIRKKRKKH
jgi:hypothetical protein